MLPIPEGGSLRVYLPIEDVEGQVSLVVLKYVHVSAILGGVFQKIGLLDILFGCLFLSNPISMSVTNIYI